ncbi:MAG: flagellar hook-length control protein FliK [Gammaproteobacteria bacterium]|nr:flagellar hook-length control protein FliK [Gammaproteobacteria bacterium]
MEIKPPVNDLYTAIARNVSATSENNLSTTTATEWKVSQLIQAVITRITDKQLFLDIQGIKANTAKPANLDIQTGDILKLQIEQLRPMPQFRIVGLQKVADNTLIAQALKTVLAQNTSTAPVLKDISYIANRPSLRPSPLAAKVNAAVREIYQHLPSPFNLKTATQLKTHLQNSGSFLEGNIKKQVFSSTPSTPGTVINKTPRITPQISANVKSTLDLDLGAQLHRLANLIRAQLSEPQTLSPLTSSKTPVQPGIATADNKTVAQQATPRPQVEQSSLQNITQREEAMQTFLRQVESSLSHMQQTQLQSLNESQAGRPQWLMELPIKDGQDIDLFELRISEEESSQSEGEVKKSWNVILQFDLTGLGKVKAQIKMQDDFISAQFISEKPETLSLFKDNFDFLKNRLSYNGLNVGNIDCVHANLSNNTLTETSKKLDERT